MEPKISNVFLTYASDVLAETNTGMTSSQIGRYFSAKSLDFSVDIPHHKPPFNDVPNKRTAFLENIQCFNTEQQFEILHELIDEYKDVEGVKELRTRLISKYPDSTSVKSSIETEKTVQETLHWLSGYPKAASLYHSAIEKFNFKVYSRNLIDDLRLSLELLLKDLLGNNKSLENQIAEVSKYQENKCINKEINNMFNRLLDYYSKYQNKYAKHDDNVNEKEIEFIIDLTSAFMKFILKD